MLITFSSDAYANVTLLGDIAQRLLTLMGHSGAVPSAFTAAEVPRALAQLQQALKMQPPSVDVAVDEEEAGPAVSLLHRALPLIQLLEAAAKQNTYVSWRQGF